MQTILLSPHNDDAVLFASFTAQNSQAQVVTVYDSHTQARRGFPVSWQARRAEDEAACLELDIPEPIFLGLSDDDPSIKADDIARSIENVILAMRDEVLLIAPVDYRGHGHPHHDAVGRAVLMLAGPKSFYHTYVTGGFRQRVGFEVEPKPGQLQRKLRAMACYHSQIDNPKLGCLPWFLSDQKEWIA